MVRVKAETFDRIALPLPKAMRMLEASLLRLAPRKERIGHVLDHDLTCTYHISPLETFCLVEKVIVPTISSYVSVAVDPRKPYNGPILRQQ